MQPGAVWRLLLKGGTEGPALISCAARRHQFPSVPVSWHTVNYSGRSVVEVPKAVMQYPKAPNSGALGLSWMPRMA